MRLVQCLRILARALDWVKDPDPDHWKTINGSHVHLDKNGNYDGGAGSKFNGRHHYGPGWKQKSALMNRLAAALHTGVNQKNVAPPATNSGQGTANGGNLNTEEQRARESIKKLEAALQKREFEFRRAHWHYRQIDHSPEAKKRCEEAAQKLRDAEAKLDDARNEATKKGILFVSAAWAKIDADIKAHHVPSLPVQRHKKKLTENEIISRLAGGDKTKGSCSTLAFAYIANKFGLDVLDFRGGSSQELFSKVGNIREIGKLNGIKSQKISVKNEAKEGAKILLGLEKGKEYYFSIGRHAAIIKNTDDGIKYLEMQSQYPERNGWQNMGKTASAISAKLHDRFDAAKSQRRLNYMPIMSSAILMEVDSFNRNKEFEKLTEYFNTNAKDQMKGASGHVR